MNQYDVRVIQMIKSTPEQSLRAYLNAEPEEGIENVYTCLGHFDILNVSEKLNKSGSQPLEAIGEIARQRPKKHSNFCYPLYILREERDPTDTMMTESFWEADTIFAIVARIHCDRLEGQENSPPFSELLRRSCLEMNLQSVFRIKEIGSVIVIVPKGGGSYSFGVFYESLELGDIVGIFKGNSLSLLLELSQKIYAHKNVSDMYSYLGINRNVFLPKPPELSGTLLSEEITYAITRFSVKNATLAHQLFEKNGYSEKGAYVIGGYDVNMNWAPIKVRDLLEIAKTLVNASGPNASPRIYNAFYDVITRVGGEYKTPINSRAENDRIKRQYSLPTQDELSILNNTLIENQPWLPILKRLLDTLDSMYFNSVMDNLSYLIAPSMRALLRRINDLCRKQQSQAEAQKNARWPISCNEDIFMYLESCTSLMNDITHIEGQLVQHPELHPVRYYIPAMLLQFEQYFVNFCGNILTKIEGASRPNRRFFPILIPRLIPNECTHCILDDTEQTEQRDYPLQIQLPIAHLYKPWMISHILCHEIAHYCGEEIRNRVDRLKSIERCCSIGILRMWETRTCLNEFVTQEEREMFEILLTERLDSMLPIETEFAYLQNLRRKLSFFVAELCSDDTLFEGYRTAIICNEPKKNQLNYASRRHARNQSAWAAIYRDYFAGHIPFLLHFYKECYADIAMIFLLDCNSSDYYACVFAEEYERLKSNNPEDQKMYRRSERQHIIRMALVINTIKQILPHWDEGMPCNYWTQRAKAWEGYLSTCIYQAKKMEDGTLFIAEFIEIGRYLLTCAHKFNERAKNNDDVKTLRDTLSAVGQKQFDWAKLRACAERSAED